MKMNKVWRAVATQSRTVLCAGAWSRKTAIRLGRGTCGEEGSTIAETALVLPVLLVVLTGIFSFGIAMNQYLVLTNATNSGARAFALSRGSGTSSTATNADPCTLAATTLSGSSTNLNTSSLTYTIVYTVTSTSTPTTYTAAAGTIPTCAGLTMTSGDVVSVKAVYPVNIVMYKLSKSLSLTAQSTELVQ